jgi:hypothetical protein
MSMTPQELPFEMQKLISKIDRSHMFIDSLFEAIKLRRAEVVEDEQELIFLAKQLLG